MLSVLSNKADTAAQDPRPQKRVRFNLPSDEAGEIEEKIKEKTPQHENKQNRGHYCRGWCHRFTHHALTPPFDVLFKNKSNDGQNQEPGMFGKKADGLPSCFEKEADYRADKPR